MKISEGRIEKTVEIKDGETNLYIEDKVIKEYKYQIKESEGDLKVYRSHTHITVVNNDFKVIFNGIKINHGGLETIMYKGDLYLDKIVSPTLFRATTDNDSMIYKHFNNFYLASSLAPLYNPFTNEIKVKEESKDKVVVNGDDDNLKSLSNVIFFGINNKSMFNARNIRYENGAEYDLYYKDDKLGHVSLAYYGEYMVYDSLAALTVALCLGVDINVAITAIKKFNGLKRRFKETIVNDDVYIDDYAHHPSKIKATIEAVKQKYPRKKIIAFFRPDRVPRLNYFSSSFAEELLKADKAYILPFINNKHEEKESINTFIFNYPDIELADNRVYKMVSEYNGVCYLMMSSKDMSEVKESILKYKGD